MTSTWLVDHRVEHRLEARPAAERRVVDADLRTGGDRQHVGEVEQHFVLVGSRHGAAADRDRLDLVDLRVRQADQADVVGDVAARVVVVFEQADALAGAVDALPGRRRRIDADQLAVAGRGAVLVDALGQRAQVRGLRRGAALLGDEEIPVGQRGQHAHCREHEDVDLALRLRPCQVAQALHRVHAGGDRRRQVRFAVVGVEAAAVQHVVVDADAQRRGDGRARRFHVQRHAVGGIGRDAEAVRGEPAAHGGVAVDARPVAVRHRGRREEAAELRRRRVVDLGQVACEAGLVVTAQDHRQAQRLRVRAALLLQALRRGQCRQHVPRQGDGLLRRGERAAADQQRGERDPARDARASA